MQQRFEARGGRGAPREPEQLAVSPDDRVLVLCRQHRLEVYGLDDPRLLDAAALSQEASALGFLDASTVVVGGKGGAVARVRCGPR
jgi:hypothetical protein